MLVSLLALAAATAVPAPVAIADVAGSEAEGEPIVVTGTRDTYQPRATSSATRTETELKDVPQAVSIVTAQQIDDQALRSMGELLRYVPGAVISQGEGHRDQVILRGNSSSADFFVDGLRDDVQYYRGLYNLERVEVLKGPNAMIFGRGGGGGIVNRVTKKPGPRPGANAALSLDGYGAWFVEGDVNEPLGHGVYARLNGTYEAFDGFRDAYGGHRIGLNPTLAFEPTGRTRIDLSYEYDADRRVVDRGVPSDQRTGAATLANPAPPLAGYRRTFFGVPGLNRTTFDAHVVRAQARHEFSESLSFTSRFLDGDYDKFYRNAMAQAPATLVGGAAKVGIEAYQDATQRRNLFSQNDLVWKVATGPVRHVVLAGVEGGRQETDGQRQNGFFGNARRVSVDLAPVIAVPPVTFRTGLAAAERLTHGVATILAFYLQDQISIGDHVDVVAGLRHDRFRLEASDLLAGTKLARTDGLWSPRLGLVLKPRRDMSLYASYSRSYLPQSGDQFASLDLTQAALKPERFDNVELGLKWDIRPALSLTAAVYRLDRTNSRSPDPANPARTILTGAQRSKGIEIGLSGEIRPRWHVSAGYAYQEAEISRTTAAAPAGRQVALVPRHQASLWTRYDLTARFGIGAGIYHQSKSFTSISNLVVLPAFTRVDAAAYYKLSRAVELQVNVENALDADYFASAFNDNNIMPGAPASVRGTLRFQF
ncbi:MAG: TonB-dependent siderophore receptor [Alphaproteobacteria bacterium]|nr:TonB-dependent siderophore receptor [Alphaproteobacteria bacterium]